MGEPTRVPANIDFMCAKSGDFLKPRCASSSGILSPLYRMSFRAAGDRQWAYKNPPRVPNPTNDTQDVSGELKRSGATPAAGLGAWRGRRAQERTDRLQ